LNGNIPRGSFSEFEQQVTEETERLPGHAFSVSSVASCSIIPSSEFEQEATEETER
jgi:hypothetical protein